MSKRIKNSGVTAGLVSEYWQPRRDWTFWEYFGPSFTVIEEADPANAVDVFAFGIAYEENDLNLSKSL